MMEKADSGQKLYTKMRLWEFPDQYIVEPTDGSSASCLAISREDGSMKLIGWILYLIFLFDVPFYIAFMKLVSIPLFFCWLHFFCLIGVFFLLRWTSAIQLCPGS